MDHCSPCISEAALLVLSKASYSPVPLASENNPVWMKAAKFRARSAITYQDGSALRLEVSRNCIYSVGHAYHFLFTFNMLQAMHYHLKYVVSVDHLYVPPLDDIIAIFPTATCVVIGIILLDNDDFDPKQCSYILPAHTTPAPIARSC